VSALTQISYSMTCACFAGKVYYNILHNLLPQYSRCC